MLELFRTFKIASLKTTRATVRASDNAVTISGEQTGINASGTDRMLFTRVYVMESPNSWKLLASTQFRKP
jgi:allophanate hydrolase subunit 1